TPVRYKKFIHGPLSQEQLTRLPSGLFVATAKHNKPPDVAHLALVYRAGIRYESTEQIGLTRLVRSIIFNNPKKIGSEQMQFPNGSEIRPFLTHDYLGVRVQMPLSSSQLALEYLRLIAALKERDLDHIIHLNLLSSILHKDGSLYGHELPPSMLAADYVRRAAYGAGALGTS
ncbi:hypothetical protein PMAYCL1PPCAC_20439, partial [Pristionchus mayeri]